MREFILVISLLFGSDEPYLYRSQTFASAYSGHCQNAVSTAGAAALHTAACRATPAARAKNETRQGNGRRTMGAADAWWCG
jgi:hypothetical protein